MTGSRRWTAIFAALLVPAALSCADSKLPLSVPVPGTLIVSLQADGTPAGAVLISLRGSEIGAPTALDATHAFFVRQVDDAGSEWQVAVMGAEVNGDLLSFAVPDVTRPEAYSATLIQVADRADNPLADLAGYRLSVLPKR